MAESQIDILLQKAEKYKEVRNLLQWISVSQEIELVFEYAHGIPGVGGPIKERKNVPVDDDIRRAILSVLSKRIKDCEVEFDKYYKEVYEKYNGNI